MKYKKLIDLQIFAGHELLRRDIPIWYWQRYGRPQFS